MAELSEPHKEQIVVLLAHFRGAAEVAVAMKNDHGLELTVQQIVKYDCAKPSYEAGEKWRPIFEAARQAYLEDVKTVPAANQGYRLQMLQEGIEAARKAKNWKLLSDLLEQAAKEVGGVLTNTRELNVNDSRRVKDMSSEDRKAMLGSILAEELAKAEERKPTIQ